MIAQYDKAEDLLLRCIAENTTITDLLYVWCTYVIMYINLYFCIT